MLSKFPKNIAKVILNVTQKLKPRKELSTLAKGTILGIETSCDDTGCAIIDTDGNILGEALKSQHLIHLNNGGIIPPIAQDLHRKHIENIVNRAVDLANINYDNVDAIAVTVKPGLPLSLDIGIKYGKYLCRKFKKPFIPIHHMEAHALTARLFDKSIQFPFLVLLISGGHCLIAVALEVNKFLLLGKSIDEAPGEAFDKVARRMKLRNLPEYSELNGGQAIELAASRADNPLQYKFTLPLLQYKNCNFSFTGARNQLRLQLIEEEKHYNVPADCVIPGVNNMSAGFQLVVTRHLCQRVQRAMEYVSIKKLIPPNNQVLVVSGGAACNNFILKGLQIVCNELNYKVVRPPPKLCTDNGVMIAWNGVEKWKKNIDIFNEFEDIDLEKNAPLGETLIEDVEKEQINCSWVKLKELTLPQTQNLEKIKSQKIRSGN